MVAASDYETRMTWPPLEGKRALVEIVASLHPFAFDKVIFTVLASR